MARKPARWLVRLGVAVTSWTAVVTVAQGVLGPDLGRAAEQLEERIELQLRGAPSDPQPERSHEDESFEPWELVSV